MSDVPRGTEWPTCGVKTRLLGFDLECVLPAHHLMDGQDMHEDGKGTQWAITLTFDDGRPERRL